MFLLLLILLAQPLLAQAPLTPHQMAKAQALLRRQLPCLGCHELDGEGGRVGPSLTTVGERRTGAYIRAMIADPQTVVPGAAMPRIRMTDATRELVTRYLARNARPGEVVAPSRSAARTPAPVQPPPQLYARWCASCHGANGDGNGPNARYLPVRPAIHSDARAMRRRSDDALFDVIAVGGGAAGRSVRMPAFGATLSPAEIRGLVSHIRALCKCEGPAWSLDGGNR